MRQTHTKNQRFSHTTILTFFTCSVKSLPWADCFRISSSALLPCQPSPIGPSGQGNSFSSDWQHNKLRASPTIRWSTPNGQHQMVGTKWSTSTWRHRIALGIKSWSTLDGQHSLPARAKQFARAHGIAKLEK
jgi:hypothetical protein